MVASNAVAAVVGKVVVAVNSNHAALKVVRSLVTPNPQKNRLVVSAMPNRQANNNVAAVRVNLPLRSNLFMPGYARHKTDDKDPNILACSPFPEWMRGKPHIRKTSLRAAFQKQKNHYP